VLRRPRSISQSCSRVVSRPFQDPNSRTRERLLKKDEKPSKVLWVPAPILGIFEIKILTADGSGRRYTVSALHSGSKLGVPSCKRFTVPTLLSPLRQHQKSLSPSNLMERTAEIPHLMIDRFTNEEEYLDQDRKRPTLTKRRDETPHPSK